MPNLTCDVCGRVYQPLRVTGRNRYCSIDCADIARKTGIAHVRTVERVVGTMKRCTKCHRLLDVSMFPIRKDRGNRPRSHCRTCHNAAAKTAESRRLQREWRYSHHYGVTAAEVDALYDELDGKCEICERQIPRSRIHVDHDHASGSFRGILCHQCNSGLGQFYDKPEALEAAARYLRERTPHVGSVPIKK